MEALCGKYASTYEAYFNEADTKKTGIIGAREAALYLKKSGFADKVLGKIWDMSDPTGKGYLDKQGFFTALKFIALSQSGMDVSTGNLGKDSLPPNLGPLPVETLDKSNSEMDWAIPATEISQFHKIFNDLVPENGLLTGEKVKPVLINSKLAVDVLGKVWELSDYDKDGMLDIEEFSVAMHLVYRTLAKDPLPSTLPSNLIPPSKRKKTGFGAPSINPISSLQWVVSPAEKIKFDELFKVADTDKDGFVNGTEIKATFLQSGLQQNTLAHIWTLCDTMLLGKLNSEEFALAMYLIEQKLKGIDPPEKLLPEMIPPSMRAPTEGVTGPVTDFSTAGMKELDILQKEIDDIKGEKLQLEQERSQIEADIKIRNGDVQSLQKELDVINGTVNKLENQKSEAQKRLDELDDKKTKIQSDIEVLKEKCNEENDQMLKLQQKISTTESTTKNQEEELKTMRDELNILRKEEIELQQKIETGKAQLEQLTRNTSAIPHSGDPFASQDPFKNEDPFNGTDPFKSSDPFGGKDPFGGDGGGAKHTKTQPPNNDPFGGSTFSGSTTGKHDPFAPFGTSNTLTSPIDLADPFGTDPFNPSSSNKSKLAPSRPGKSPLPRSKSPAPPIPSLPPKQKKAPAPPRPPAPRPGSAKPPSPVNSDPFGGFDPFGTNSASAQSTLTTGGSGFADFSASKFESRPAGEEDQLAWATRSSQDEWERQKRLKEQEEADLELAIKLSQQS